MTMRSMASRTFCRSASSLASSTSSCAGVSSSSMPVILPANVGCRECTCQTSRVSLSYAGHMPYERYNGYYTTFDFEKIITLHKTLTYTEKKTIKNLQVTGICISLGEFSLFLAKRKFGTKKGQLLKIKRREIRI